MARGWRAKKGTYLKGKEKGGDCKLSRSPLKRTGVGLIWQPPHPRKPARQVDTGLLSSEIWHIPRPRQRDWGPSRSWARASPSHSCGQRFRVACWCQLLMATLQLPLGSPTDLQKLQVGGGRAPRDSRARQGEL